MVFVGRTIAVVAKPRHSKGSRPAFAVIAAAVFTEFPALVLGHAGTPPPQSAKRCGSSGLKIRNDDGDTAKQAVIAACRVRFGALRQ